MGEWDLSLPKYNTEDRSLSLLMTNWPRVLDPLLDSPIATPILLQDVVLIAGQTVIDHKLGKKLTGWEIVRQRGDASVWDNQDGNPLPDKNLWLMASSGVSVDLLVF